MVLLNFLHIRPPRKLKCTIPDLLESSRAPYLTFSYKVQERHIRPSRKFKSVISDDMMLLNFLGDRI
jgi:hypothetical protein